MKTFHDQRTADFFRDHPIMTNLLRVAVNETSETDEITVLSPKFAVHVLDAIVNAAINAPDLDDCTNAQLEQLFPDAGDTTATDIILDMIQLFQS